ncbi:MAG: hypothetical protein KME10_11330 [Plectolyngbya sp. WJT66-NPBG17]|jgi:hypothetical protein|nr:hypothetical protein [Plectolyngbya sp. WJT66-NPBG17]MBW4528690.1 hypothetical protein [Phormidium tanganyikae FI6-MK23]
MARPKEIMAQKRTPETPKKLIGVCLPQEYAQQAKEEAKKRNVSVSLVIAERLLSQQEEAA